MQNNTNAKREFIPTLEAARAEIAQLETQLGKPLTDFSNVSNIDTLNEEVVRLDAALASKSSSQAAPTTTATTAASATNEPAKPKLFGLARAAQANGASRATELRNPSTEVERPGGLYGHARAAKANEKLQPKGAK